MECPQCGLSNPPGVSVCTTCATPLPWDDRTLTISPGSRSPFTGTSQPPGVGSGQSARSAWSSTAEPASFTAALEPGRVLGNRYEILQILGEGGMGAVYKSMDRELERLVAIKVIRPELARYPDVLQRFKQELILARQVTHRNVIRIFDLGEAEGIKFITMEYIEGRDLKGLIREKGKFEPKAAVDVIAQVCRALEAAHSEGVIHRDLKPQNIMVDPQGKVSVMDFGIARSMEMGGGMTQTGALVGTIEYMSPEQAKGETLDARSDLFSLGIIFYEVLTGNSPFVAETAMASLYKRIKETARPPIELRPDIPRVLNNIVLRCLETDREKRYANAAEILQDLGIWQGTRMGTVVAPARSRFPIEKFARDWKWIAGAAAVVLLAVFGVLLRGKFTSVGASETGPVMPQVSLAILPFHNASGDPSLDWLGPSLADMLSTDVGESAHMRTVSPDRVHQVLADLQIGANTNIDPTMIGRVAEFSSADTVVSGEYAKFGDQIRIDAVVRDLKHDRQTPLKIEVSSEKEIPNSIDQLAGSIRKNLSVSPDVLKELKASSFQPSSSSVPALRDYSQGMQQLRDGKNLAAVKAFQTAVSDDPSFALAYSRLAEADSALGYDSDAQKASNKAVDLSQQLPTAEKYLIQASHARIVKDDAKSIEAYENLAKIFPDNSDVEYDLGAVYMENGDYAKSQAEFAKILKEDPKNIKALWQTGVLDVTMGNPQAALDPLNQGLSLSVQVDNQEQKALILLAMGISYRLLNKPDEAMRNYQESMAITKPLGLKRIYANTLTEVALVQSTLGKPDAALDSYAQALQLLRDIGVKKELGNALISRGVLYESRGNYDKALEDYKDSLQIERDANDQNLESLCLNNIGGVYLTKGDTDNALTYLQQSLDLRQKTNHPQPQYVAETLDSLGEVYCATGDYNKALSSFLSALDVSRKANDVWNAAAESDEIGKVFRYEGRLGAAVNAFQDAVKGYQAVGNQSLDMAEALTDLADSLALAGRGSESAKPLEQAQELARGLKNAALESEVLNAQGDAAMYRGDPKAAESNYTEALHSATQGKAPDKALVSRLNLAKVALAEGQYPSANGDFRGVVQQADSLRLKYLSLEGSLGVAEAMIGAKNYGGARQELENNLSTSETLGLRLDTAEIHYFLGNVLRLTGSAEEASGHYSQVVNILNDLKAEAGADHLLDRSDVRAIYADATRRSQTAATPAVAQH
jgi:eukaryotic-like serine/threonine-protein kinase